MLPHDTFAIKPVLQSETSPQASQKSAQKVIAKVSLGCPYKVSYNRHLPWKKKKKKKGKKKKEKLKIKN